jgi:hypothetical protein
MRTLSKFLLALFLLTFTGVSWAACPEGQKQTYKGCEPISGKVTEEQPDVIEVTSEILELGGFVSEEIQIGIVESDVVEMSVSVGGINRGDDWLWRSFNVVLPGGDFGTISGKVGLVVAWWNGSEKKPNKISMKFDPMTLPSIDIQDMRSCSMPGSQPLAREDGIRLVFWQLRGVIQSHCIYKKLSEVDQVAVTAFVNQIETIVEKGTEGAPDADYWKKIARRIVINSPFVLLTTETGLFVWCWDEPKSAVYPTTSGMCKQPEHGPITQADASVRIREHLNDEPL